MKAALGIMRFGYDIIVQVSTCNFDPTTTYLVLTT